MAEFTYYIDNQPRTFNIPDDVYETVSFVWNDFKKNIVNKNRYFSGKELLEILSRLNDMPVFPKNAHITFYRARIGNFLNSSDDNMLAPPFRKATAGRCNPEGISYLYLANTSETAIREIKPQIGDIVTIAMFDVDVSKIFSFNVYLMEHYGIIATNIYVKCLLFFILEDLSTAITLENHLDYIPLQYISEYIKSLGYYGFSYTSVYKTGLNLVMFDWNNRLKLISKELIRIDNTNIKYTKLM